VVASSLFEESLDRYLDVSQLPGDTAHDVTTNEQTPHLEKLSKKWATNSTAFEEVASLGMFTTNLGFRIGTR